MPKSLRHSIRSLKPHNRKHFFGLAVVAVLFIVGLTAIGFGLAAQRKAPMPSASSAGSLPTSPKKNSTHPSGAVLAYSEPTALSIPGINVSSSIIQVAKNDDGTIGVPAVPNFDKPAWYKYSPAPGQYGAAIIVGHVDNYKTGASIFFNLGKLTPGNSINVTRADGKTAHFVVTAVREYSKANFPTSTVYIGDNDAELRLITCGGSFDKTIGHYDSNIIVFAKLTGSTG